MLCKFDDLYIRLKMKKYIKMDSLCYMRFYKKFVLIRDLNGLKFNYYFLNYEFQVNGLIFEYDLQGLKKR